MTSDPLNEPIPAEDLSVCRGARKMFIEHRALLLQKLMYYPLECHFSHVRLVLETEQHIDQLVEHLDREFERIDGSPNALPPPPTIFPENPEDVVRRYVRPGGILAEHIPYCRVMIQALNEGKNHQFVAYLHRRGVPVIFNISGWRSFVCWNQDEYDGIIHWLEKAIERCKPRLVA